jgi:hypothetical protein
MKWTAKNEVLFEDIRNPDRREKFAAKIHPDNILESKQNTSTHLESRDGNLLELICICHDDLHNPDTENCRGVIGMSIILSKDGELRRVGVNGQGRKSVENSLGRGNKYRPMVETVILEYEKMPDERRVISKALFEGKDGGGLLLVI